MAKFVLIGGGDIVKGDTVNIDRFILGLNDGGTPSVLFFPTAANDSDEYAGIFHKYYKSLGCNEVESCFVQKESRKEILVKMQKANIIYFGGGVTSLLIDQFIKKKLVVPLMKLAKREVVIVGMSAGAIAIGEFALLSELEMPTVKFGQGWNLLPKHLFVPHYAQNFQQKIDKIQEKYSDQVIVTIREKQAYFFETTDGKISRKILIKG